MLLKIEKKLTSPHLPPVLTLTVTPGWCADLTVGWAISGVMATLLPLATRAQDWSTQPILACAATPWSGEMCPAATTGSGALVRTCSVSTLGTQEIKETEQLLRRIQKLSKLYLNLTSARTSQTGCSRRGSPVQTRQTTFAGRAVTRRGPTAQPVPTQLTSDAPSLISVFILTYFVTVTPSVRGERMKIWKFAVLIILKWGWFTHMHHQDAGALFMITWRSTLFPVTALPNVLMVLMRMNHSAIF